jgi:hypothetical protein
MTRAINVGSPFKLPRRDKEVFLSLLLKEWTLRGRGAYEAGTRRADGQRLRVFNEISHRIACQMSHAFLGDSSSYPDDVFVQMLHETAEQGHLAGDLEIAFDAARAAWRGRE